MTFGLKAQNEITDVTFSASYNQAGLSEILVDISKRTDVNISFDPKLVVKYDNITLQVQKEKLGDVLDVLLDDKNLGYIIAGKQLVIVADDPTEKEFTFPTIELSGYIEDGSSGERLPYAYLYTPDRDLVVTTNEYGFYSFSVPAGVDGLYVSYLGYKDTLIGIDDLQSGSFTVPLQSSTNLDEVVITDKDISDPLETFDPFNTSELATIKATQTFGGQMDVFRHIQTLPGVSTGADGLGGFSVRGANVDNNLILLDGIPVYNSSHALGVISIFDESSIKSSRFYRSHIPAQYGGRLASVLDIRTKEGSLTEFNGEVSVGLITANVFLEGPIIKDKVSFAVSARRTLFEPYLNGLSSFLKDAQDNGGQTSYFFGDLNAKLQYVVNDKNRIYLSYYGGRDNFKDVTTSNAVLDTLDSETEDIYDWEWGNRLIALRWSSQVSSTMFSNVSLFSTNYDFSALNYTRQQLDSEDVNLYFSNVASLYNTQINDIGIKWDLDSYINDKNRVKVGVNAIRHVFSPGLLTLRNEDPDVDSDAFSETVTDNFVPEERKANEVEAYYEHEYRYRNTLINAGARATLLNTLSRNYISVQPRLSLKSKIAKKFYGKFSANYTTQYLHLLASSGLGLPTDIWVPSTRVIRPQKAIQASAGFEFEIRKGLVFSTEGYYKYLWDILSLKEGAVFSVIEDEEWENNIPVGEGRAYGWENSIVGSYGKHYVNVNYTLGTSRRQFDEINAGKEFFSRFDRRHQANATYKFTLNKNISFNAQYVVASGHPITLPSLINQGQVIFTQKNGQRLPRYDRLDISMRIGNEFKWGGQEIVLGAYNVYNKQNPYYYFVDFETPTEFQLKQITIFPILPNISYSIKF